MTSEVNKDLLRFLKYCSFKMDTLREQEENALYLDKKATLEHLEELETLKEEKVEELTKAMPKKAITKVQKMPKNPYKKDGTLSEVGKRWFTLLKEQGLPEDTTEDVTYITGWEDGNPNSPEQVKEWLYSLGWKPRTFKYTRNKLTGEEKRIPQVRDNGLLCESVRELAEHDPAIEMLDGLSVITHRIGVLKGFLKAENNGKVVAGAGGFTNTLRLQHRAPVVNLPSVEAKYGEYCRGVLIPEDGKIMVGADITSLEDTLKQHYIYPYDPEYVEEMNVEGFDSHLNLGIDAGRVTIDEYAFYLWYEKEYDK